MRSILCFVAGLFSVKIYFPCDINEDRSIDIYRNDKSYPNNYYRNEEIQHNIYGNEDRYPKIYGNEGRYPIFPKNEERHRENSVIQHDDVFEDNRVTFAEQCYALQNQFANVLSLRKFQPIPIPTFEKILGTLDLTKDVGRFTGITDRLICVACQTLVSKLRHHSMPLEKIGEGICNVYIRLNTWNLNSQFCKEVIELNKPHLEYIVKNSKIFTPELACSILLQNENCYSSHPALTWKTPVPDGPLRIPPQIEKDPNRRPLRILHLSDIHVSHDYEINGVVNCGYPLCCKKGIGNPLRGRNAGAWGDYSCDIPNWLLTNSLNFIRHTHPDIQAIYFTGDIIDHTVWRATQAQNAAEIRWSFDQIANFFPGIPVLPVLGNHESVPLNVWPPDHVTDPKLSQNWLYTLLTDIWSKWLPHNALQTVARQGYYSYLANPKLKIIALNSNVCYKWNWWLLYSTDYLKEQIHFLRDELAAAENAGQYVHILAHVFPGEKECIEPWEVNYNNIITRYAHIIKGQFFGHTHTDGLKIFYNKLNGQPINVGYNGASLTSYQKYNPNYKIISLDPNNFDVLDIETFYFNLTEANFYPDRTPRWQKLYSMNEAYGFRELTPKNFDNLVKRMSVDKALTEKYWRHYVRNGDASLKEGCNAKCRQNLISSIVTTEWLTDQSHALELKRKAYRIYNKEQREGLKEKYQKCIGTKRNGNY